MELPEEQHILREIARGNIKAFEQLFFDYQPRLYISLSAWRTTRKSVVIYPRICFFPYGKNREKLRDVRSFSSYLFQMARFTVYDYFDRLAVSEKYTNEFLLEASISQSEEEAMFARELQNLINRTVEQMSPQRKLIYKRVVGRVYWMMRSHRLGISKRTVWKSIWLLPCPFFVRFFIFFCLPVWAEHCRSPKVFHLNETSVPSYRNNCFITMKHIQR